MENCPGMMTPFPSPPYKPHPKVLYSTIKLPSQYSNDMNHHTDTRTLIAERDGERHKKEIISGRVRETRVGGSSGHLKE